MIKDQTFTDDGVGDQLWVGSFHSNHSSGVAGSLSGRA